MFCLCRILFLCWSLARCSLPLSLSACPLAVCQQPVKRVDKIARQSGVKFNAPLAPYYIQCVCLLHSRVPRCVISLRLCFALSLNMLKLCMHLDWHSIKANCVGFLINCETETSNWLHFAFDLFSISQQQQQFVK